MRNALGCLGLLALCVSVFWLPKAFSSEPFAFRWALPCIASVALAFYGATGPKEKPKPQDRMSTLALFALLSGLVVFLGFHFVNMFVNPRSRANEFTDIANWGGGGLFGLGLLLTLWAIGMAARGRQGRLPAEQPAQAPDDQASSDRTTG